MKYEISNMPILADWQTNLTVGGIILGAVIVICIFVALTFYRKIEK